MNCKLYAMYFSYILTLRVEDNGHCHGKDATYKIDITTLAKGQWLGTNATVDYITKFLADGFSNKHKKPVSIPAVIDTIIKLRRVDDESDMESRVDDESDMEEDESSIVKCHIILTSKRLNKGMVKYILHRLLKDKRLNKSVSIVSTGKQSFQLQLKAGLYANAANNPVDYTLDFSPVSQGLNITMAMLENTKDYVTRRFSRQNATVTVDNTTTSINIGCATFINKTAVKTVLQNYLFKYHNNLCKIMAVEDKPEAYQVVMK